MVLKKCAGIGEGDKLTSANSLEKSVRVEKGTTEASSLVHSPPKGNRKILPSPIWRLGEFSQKKG